MDHYQKILKQHKLPKKTEPLDFFQNNSISLDNEFMSNRTMLQNAIMSQDDEIINAILQIKPDFATKPHNLNTIDKTNKKWTALHYAVFNSASLGENILKLLLEAGADPNIMGSDKKTPLHLATEMGANPIIDLLLKNGANIKIESNLGGLLHIALLCDKPETFEFLISNENYLQNADLLKTDEDGNSILHIAAKNNYLDSCKSILTKFEDKSKILNLQNKSGNTALHESILSNNSEIENFLRKLPEQDLTLKNSKNQTVDQLKGILDEESKIHENELQMENLRKRKLEDEKRFEKLKFEENNAEKSEENSAEEIDENSENEPKPRHWGWAVLVFFIIAAILYGFFSYYISTKTAKLRESLKNQ